MPIDWNRVALHCGRTAGECFEVWRESPDKFANLGPRRPLDHDAIAFLENLPNLSKEDIMRELRLRGMSGKGNKPQLVLRLRESLYKDQGWKALEEDVLSEAMQDHHTNWQRVSGALKARGFERDPVYCENAARVLVDGAHPKFLQFHGVFVDPPARAASKPSSSGGGGGGDSGVKPERSLPAQSPAVVAAR